MKLCGVVIGAEIERRIVTQAPHESRPQTAVATSAAPAITASPTPIAAQRRVSAAHTNRIAGWSLTIVPTAIAAPSRAGRSIQRQPIAKHRNRIGPTWPSFTA